MQSLSRVWGYVLLVLQILNAIAAGTAFLTDALPDEQKHVALAVNATVALIVGCVQAVTKALPDEDKNGVPDLFEPTRPPK